MLLASRRGLFGGGTPGGGGCESIVVAPTIAYPSNNNNDIRFFLLWMVEKLKDRDRAYCRATIVPLDRVTQTVPTIFTLQPTETHEGKDFVVIAL